MDAEYEEFTTVFTCDVCKVASFPTFEEAEEHENNCSGAPVDAGDVSGDANTGSVAVPPAAAAAATATAEEGQGENESEQEDEVVNKTLFKCRRCKLFFYSQKSTNEHETRLCKSPPWFSCGVCHILRFQTEAEMMEHERGCEGPAPISETDVPLGETEFGVFLEVDAQGRLVKVSPKKEEVTRNSDDSSVEVVSPDVAKAASSGKEKENQIRSELPAPPVELDINSAENEEEPAAAAAVEDDFETVWTCDICEVAQFKSYEAAEKHEKTCKGRKATETTSKNKTEDKKGDKKDEHEKSQDRRRESGATAKLPASKPTKTFSHVTAAPSLPQLASKQSTNNKVLFSPILKQPSDSVNYQKLSTHYNAMFQSLNLLYQPDSGNIAFQCHHCSYNFPDEPWTFDKIVNSLPEMVVNHARTPGRRSAKNSDGSSKKGEIVKGCEKFPHDALTKLLNSEQFKSSGKISLTQFVKEFFAENGILGKGLGDSVSLSVVPDGDFKKVSGFEKSKRGKLLLPEPTPSPPKSKRPTKSKIDDSTATPAQSPPKFTGAKKKRDDTAATTSQSTTPPKKQKTSRSKSLSPVSPNAVQHKNGLGVGDMGAKLHSDQNGDQFYLPLLDGIPLVSSITSKEAKKLPKPLVTLLDQMELFGLFPKLLTSQEEFIPHSVGIRCQNCIASQTGCCFRKLSSLSSIADDLIAMGMKHLLHCECTEASVKEEMDDLKLSDASTLAEYCDVLVKLYCLFESSNKGKPVVVWGDAPSVPTGYVGQPIDIHVEFAMKHPIKPLVRKDKTLAQSKSMNLVSKTPSPGKTASSSIMILTDYHYLLLQQLFIVPTHRKLSVARSSKRRRSKGDENQQSMSTSTSGISTPTDGSSKQPAALIAASIKCKHCGNIFNISSIQNISNVINSSYLHLKDNCPSFPADAKEKLLKCKETSSTQRSTISNIAASTDYMRKLCSVYEMAELDSNGPSSCIGFSQIGKLKSNYGANESELANISVSGKSDDNEVKNMFSLPMILENIARPATTNL